MKLLIKNSNSSVQNLEIDDEHLSTDLKHARADINKLKDEIINS